MLLQDGETPLIRATQKKHTAIVSLLLEKGASVSVADKVRDVFVLFPVSKNATRRGGGDQHVITPLNSNSLLRKQVIKYKILSSEACFFYATLKSDLVHMDLQGNDVRSEIQ